MVWSCGVAGNIVISGEGGEGWWPDMKGGGGGWGGWGVKMQLKVEVRCRLNICCNVFTCHCCLLAFPSVCYSHMWIF